MSFELDETALAIWKLIDGKTTGKDIAKKLAAKVEALECGMPWEEGVKITPLPEDGKAAWLKGLVDDATKKADIRSKIASDYGDTITLLDYKTDRIWNPQRHRPSSSGQ